MQPFYIIRTLPAAALLLCSAGNIMAQNIELSFTGVRSGKGQIIVKVFTDAKSYDDDRALKAIKFRKDGLANGAMSGKIDLPPGEYGLALLDDENATGVMEYNMVGMPKEGFGFSDFYLTGLKRPKFDQFRFTVSSGQTRKITMKLRYL